MCAKDIHVNPDNISCICLNTGCAPTTIRGNRVRLPSTHWTQLNRSHFKEIPIDRIFPFYLTWVSAIRLKPCQHTAAINEMDISSGYLRRNTSQNSHNEIYLCSDYTWESGSHSGHFSADKVFLLLILPVPFADNTIVLLLK